MNTLHKQLDLFAPAAAAAAGVTEESALPVYAVRVSSRAKRMQLRVTSAGLVEVVLPRRMHVRHVPPFVEQHQSWIKSMLGDLRRRQQQLPHLFSTRPGRLQLQAVQQTWQFSYRSAGRSRLETLAADGADHHLRVHATTDDEVPRLLRSWLMSTARQELIPRFTAVSHAIGLPFNGVRIRRQKTLWGSCNSKHNISLNSNLLFVTPQLMRYVFIHELCHTVHCNHSRRFWALVGRFEPDYKVLDRSLQAATHTIPVWAYS